MVVQLWKQKVPVGFLLVKNKFRTVRGEVLMKSCGIIAEYNPFHSGHAYHLQEARRQSGADIVTVAMSGNFTQRGEPAIFDKWQRARAALENGADLVVENPILGSAQASDLFAKSGVRILQALACDWIAFGAENGSSQEFSELAQALVEQEATINQTFHQVKNDGRSYAVQMNEAIQKVMKPSRIALEQPNNQLALAYLKENVSYPHPMQALAILRRGADHHAKQAISAHFASGTSLRLLLLAKEYDNLEQWVPNPKTLKVLEPLDWEKHWPFLRYQIILQSHADLQSIYQMEEGIEYRLKDKIKQADSFASFIGLVKNKRWTWVRLQRLCLYVLLGIKKEEVLSFYKNEPVLRILGFNKKGQAYLNQLKHQRDLTIVTNLNKKTASLLPVEIRADRIYILPSGKEQNFSRIPIMVS